MKNTNKYIAVIIGCSILLLFGVFALGYISGTKAGHHCDWTGCTYRGLTKLPDYHTPIDSIHFYNPKLSYEVAAKYQNNQKQYPYYNGEVLYPDYVHDDTLIVTDAAAMNYLIARDSLKTDGSLSDILCVGAEPTSNNP